MVSLYGVLIKVNINMEHYRVVVYAITLFCLIESLMLVTGRFNDGRCDFRLTDINLQTTKSPVVLKSFANRLYKQKIYYPQNSDALCVVHKFYGVYNFLTVACPGQKIKVIVHSNDTFETPASTVTLVGDGYDGSTKVKILDVTLPAVDTQNNYGSISCSGPIKPFMRKTADKYEIGYQLNALDFLQIIEISGKNDASWSFAQIPYISSEKFKLKENVEYKSGILYEFKTEQVDALYNLGKQSAHLEYLLQSEEIALKYTGNNHSLVKGQLLSENDFFYAFEKQATYFNENTVPIWSSINEGNWKIVSAIVRQIGRETFTNLDVYSGSIGILEIGGNAIYLGSSENPSLRINVPKFIFKLIYDRKNPDRATVFVTVNDPNPRKYSNGRLSKDYMLCEKLLGCDELYPTFSDEKLGYTYCCSLANFTYVELNEIPLSNSDSDDFDISSKQETSGISEV